MITGEAGPQADEAEGHRQEQKCYATFQMPAQYFLGRRVMGYQEHSLRNRHGFPSLVRVFLSFVFLLLAISSASSQATVFPGTTAVGGSSVPVAVTLTLPLGGTIQSVQVLGEGVAAVDFVRAGGSCAVSLTLLPTQSCTVSIVFAPASPGDRRGAIVLLDSSRNVLASQLLAAAATGPVGNFVPGLITTVAGDVSWVFDGDGRIGSDTAIFLPFGLAVDGAGNLFIADSNNNRIRRMDAVSGFISTIAGNGIIGNTGDGGSALNATLNNPSSLALDAAGNLYFADSGNNTIRRIDAFNGTITTVAGSPGQHGYGGDGGLATSATFSTPNGISFDANGDLYIADTGNHVIRLLAHATGVITTVAGSGHGGFGGDGGPATHALLNNPWSATPSPKGGFYIADQNNHRVRLVDAHGDISTLAGDGSAGFAGDEGPASAAQLNVPAALLLDVAGNLYIADSGNNRVRRVNARTGIISTMAGNNGESISGDGGPANVAGLYGPYALALDTQGSLYIADVFHNRVRKISANSAILQFPAIRSGRVSAPLTQTLENDGNAPLNVMAITAISNAQVDAGTTKCSSAAPLVPLDRCDLGVSFAPVQVGSSVSGSVNVVSDASNSPGIVHLSGRVLDVDPTVVTLASGNNPSTTGDTVILSVVVSSTGSTPTGAITLLEGVKVIGSSTLQAGGVGSFTITNFVSGSHSLTAAYVGDSSNAAGLSPVLLQVVKDKQAPTATTISTSATPVTAGASFTLTATIATVTSNSGNGNIGGSVAFKDGVNTLGVATVGAGATPNLASASLALTNLPIGVHSIVAVFSGSSSYGGSSSASLREQVDIAATKITLTSAANPATAGAPLNIIATVISTGGGVPTGPVSFFDGSTSLGIGTVDAHGIARLSVSGQFWAPGTHSLTAVYAGDLADSGSSSLPFGETIVLASTTTTLASALNPAGAGAVVPLSATVTGNGGTPGGSVQFVEGAVVLGSSLVNAQGVATFSTASLTFGLHSLTAIYVGDTDDGPSSSAVLGETVLQATTVNLTLSTHAMVAGLPITLSVSVAGNSSKAITGTVRFMDGASLLATIAVDAAGSATYTTSALAPAAHTVVAAYSGDTINTPAASAPSTVNVTVAATSTTLAANGNPLDSGSMLTLTATVTGNGGSPTGSVVFTDGGVPIGTVVVASNGTAVLSLSTLAPGIHPITANYSGDTDDTASTSITIAEQITQRTAITFVSNTNPSLLTDSVLLSITVSNGVPSARPTGLVTLTDGGNALATLTLAGGTASFNLQAPTLGTHTLVASYLGDAGNKPVASQALLQVVTLRPSSTSFSSSTTALSLGQTLTLISVVQAQGPHAATGSVKFISGGTVLGSATIDAAGLGTVTFNPAEGTWNTVAEYSGDGLYAPSVSKPIVIVVGPTKEFAISTAPGLLTMQSGAHGSIALGVTTAATFTDTLAFGCAGLPASATCTFSRNQIAVGGGLPATLSVMVDTGNPLGAGPTAKTDLVALSKTLACGLPFGALLCLLFFRQRRSLVQLTRKLALLSVILLLGAGATLLSGCATSLTTVFTPAGTYTFQIVASGNKTGATQTATVQLTVTK